MSLPPSNGKTVLISGINGYIASRIGLDLLNKGYSLRGTLRNSNHADALENGAYKAFNTRVQLAIVPDITVEGAFDEAVQGVHIILHTASPISFDLKEWSDTVAPAINGSLSILTSAFKHAGPQLQSFVVTSSVAAICAPSQAQGEPREVTEEDWNEWAPQAAKDGNKAALYAASKTLAERAIWKFRDEHKPPFSISAVNPGVVTGPPVQPPPNPSNLNETLQPLWTIFSGSSTTVPAQLGLATYIDIRDVSAMHIWCAEHPTASNGQRYLLVNGRAPPQAIADVLRKRYPERRNKIPEGNRGEGYDEVDYSFGKKWGGGLVLRNDKAKEALGGKEFVGFEKSVMDTARVFEEVYDQYLDG